jgi:WD40 repeat protein
MMRGGVVGGLSAGFVVGQPAEVATLPTDGPAISFLLARTGKIGAAVCRDQKLRVWQLPEGRMLRTIDTAKRSFDSVAISGDGGWIAAGDHSGLYTVWNASTGARQMQLEMPYYPSAMAFSSDGKRLAIAPVGEPAQIYDVGSGQKLFELQRTIGGSQAVAFSPDGERIATADSDTVVRIYDGRNGELLARHTEFLLEPLAASFTVDGKQLLAAGGDKVIAVLDASTGSVVRKSAKLADPVAYLEVSPDGALAAAGLMNAENLLNPAPLVILETGSGRQVQEWLPASRALGGGWTSDGHLLVAVGTDKGLRIWRVR